ncbi:hypothetical protein Tco_1231962, partial [Tanacetum coccineum]
SAAANVSARSDASIGAGSDEMGELNGVGYSGPSGFRQFARKSMKDLEQAREKDKELFEETIEQERKLNEEKFETFKKETNDKLAEALAQLKEQPPTPHSA